MRNLELTMKKNNRKEGIRLTNKSLMAIKSKIKNGKHANKKLLELRLTKKIIGLI